MYKFGCDPCFIRSRNPTLIDLRDVSSPPPGRLTAATDARLHRANALTAAIRTR